MPFVAVAVLSPGTRRCEVKTHDVRGGPGENFCGAEEAVGEGEEIDMNQNAIR
jgi:hypothetical protein